MGPASRNTRSEQLYRQPERHGNAPKVSDDNARIVVTAGEVEIGINKNTGLLASYKVGDKWYFDEKPTPNFWRAPTDNDFGNGMPSKCNIWRAAGENRSLKNIDVKEENGQTVITANLFLNDVAADYQLIYTVNGDGGLTVTVNYKAGAVELPEMPRFGMIMTLDKSLDNFTFYGRGPWGFRRPRSYILPI